MKAAAETADVWLRGNPRPAAVGAAVLVLAGGAAFVAAWACGASGWVLSSVTSASYSAAITPTSTPAGIGRRLTRLSGSVDSSATGLSNRPKVFFVAVATKEPRLGGASITNRPSFAGR